MNKRLPIPWVVTTTEFYDFFYNTIVVNIGTVLISTALFTVLLAYHEFLLVLVLAKSEWTMSVAISQYAGSQYSSRSTLPFAASVSATLLIMVVVLVFQKQLVKGITAGAVKG
jgi:trehalose/maltose transport system permease protein